MAVGLAFSLEAIINGPLELGLKNFVCGQIKKVYKIDI
jgi:hypothetical protein